MAAKDLMKRLNKNTAYGRFGSQSAHIPVTRRNANFTRLKNLDKKLELEVPKTRSPFDVGALNFDINSLYQWQMPVIEPRRNTRLFDETTHRIEMTMDGRYRVSGRHFKTRYFESHPEALRYLNNVTPRTDRPAKNHISEYSRLLSDRILLASLGLGPDANAGRTWSGTIYGIEDTDPYISELTKRENTIHAVTTLGKNMIKSFDTTLPKINLKNIQQSYKDKRYNFKKWRNAKIKKFNTWYYLRKDGPAIPYESLKNITDPVVICYRHPHDRSEDKTRVLYPNGECFVHYRGYVPNLKDVSEKNFSVSCFSEHKYGLEHTVDGMKGNDKWSQLTIRKVYPYKGEPHSYFKNRVPVELPKRG